MAVTITEGTSVDIYTKVNAGTEIQVVKLDVGSGTAIADFGGTLTEVGNLVKGTITALAKGTISAGTIDAGSLPNVAQVHNAGPLQAGTVQINTVPVQTPLTFGTLGTAGGSFFATVSGASGAGTKHYITGYQIVVQSGTPDVRILTGTAIQGTGFLAGGAFPPGGGIARDLTLPFATGTNSEITYHFVGAGTALIGVNYWKGA